MRLILPDNQSLAIVAGAGLCPASSDWRGLFEICLEYRNEKATKRCQAPSEMNLPEPQSRAETRQRRMMSRSAILSAWAVRQVLGELDERHRHLATGLFMGVGASQGSMETLDAMLEQSFEDDLEDGVFSERRFGRDGLAAGNPLFAFQLMNNYTMCHAAILEGVGGANNAFFSQGSGTVLALIEASYAVLDGEASRALAGGADSVNHPVMQDELERRGLVGEGFVGSEGAGIVAVEQVGDSAPALAELEHAATYNARGCDVADVLDEALREAGECHVVLLAPWGDAAREAMHDALDRAQTGAIRVDLTAALGDALAATPALAWLAGVDAIESHAIESVNVLGMGIDGDVTTVVLSAPCVSDGVQPGLEALPPKGAEHIPVVTGCGVISAFGVGADCFFDALSSGKSAVGPIACFDAATFDTRVGGEVTDRAIDAAWLREHLPGADDRAELLEAWQQSGALRDRKVGFALLAAAEAWRQAGAGPQQAGATVSLGLGLERALLEDFADHSDSELPEVRHRVPVDFAARRVCDWLGLDGTVAVNVSACAAGGLSVAHAASLISRGVASTVVCGAADSMLNPLGVGGMSRLRAPSPRNEPDACRPFDRRRDGLAMGEGAAIFVVESLAQARQRGARPLAKIAGWASTQDGFATTKPRPDGAQAALAIDRALQRAGMEPGDIDYINAHGTGTPLNDPAEVAAIRAALGAHADQVLASSIKGATGHAMAASGALELAACLLAFERDMVPGTAHLADLDPACDLPIVGPSPQKTQANAVLSNSFGFGGQNVSIILERP
jgi:3-oxoacyl-(acyl-carrier-protein) synthase